jgi:hypothetical protein
MPTYSTEETKSLLEINRSVLRAAFAVHSPNKEGRIQFAEVLKFSKAVCVVPDLISLADLKKLIETVTGIGFSPRSMVNFFQFEQMVRELAGTAFSSAIPIKDREKMLVLHIKSPLQSAYSLVIEEPRNSHGTTPALSERKGKRESKKIDLDISAALSALKTPTQRASSSGRNTPNFQSPKAFSVKSTRKSLVASTSLLSKHPKKTTLTLDIPTDTPLMRKSLVTPRRPQSSVLEKSLPPQELVSLISPKAALTRSSERLPLKKVEFKGVLRTSTAKKPAPEETKTPLMRYAMSLKKHRDFILKRTKRSFTQDFALRVILRAWKECTKEPDRN